MTNSKVFLLVLIGFVYHDHRSAPVKGIRAAPAALDRCLVDDLSAGKPIRTTHAAWQRHTTRRGITVRLFCILSALPPVSGAASACGSGCQCCVSTAIAAPAFTGGSNADMISLQMQSIYCSRFLIACCVPLSVSNIGISFSNIL